MLTILTLKQRKSLERDAGEGRGSKSQTKVYNDLYAILVSKDEKLSRLVAEMCYTNKRASVVVETTEEYRVQYRGGQRELLCVFVDPEKEDDRLLKEELWY